MLRWGGGFHDLCEVQDGLLLEGRDSVRVSAQRDRDSRMAKSLINDLMVNVDMEQA